MSYTAATLNLENTWKKLALNVSNSVFRVVKFVKADTTNVHNYLVQPLHKQQCTEI